jgi:hypothetical protein
MTLVSNEYFYVGLNLKLEKERGNPEIKLLFY